MEPDEAGRSRRPTLMVYHRDGVDAVELKPQVPVIVGRAAPAHLTPRSARLSRQHARFELVQDEVWVTDLDSTNGTFLNGERLVGRHRMGPGDEVVMGSVTVNLHHPALDEPAVTGVDSHEAFLAQLEAELSRSRLARRPLGLLMVRALDRAGRPGAWLPPVRAALPAGARLAWYGPDTVEVLLPGHDREAARGVATRLAEVGVATGGLGVALVSYPDGPRTADGLLAALREACLKSTKDEPIAVHQPAAVSLTQEGGDEGPVVRDPAMVDLFRTLERIAPSNLSVLLLGETGVGKEVIARALHERSRRADRPMKSINCGALPASLLESVLFGHERGAFTGADRVQRGVFEEADGGTLLLDEIGELSAPAQVALLRVLETKRILRVGSMKEIPVDVRVIAATHRDLESMCQEGSFRWDLLYRLNTLTVDVPALRERPQDIRPLVVRFLSQAAQANERKVQGITPDALMLLERYPWPGNVRELRNVIERAVVIAPGELVTVEELPGRLKAVVDDARRAAARTVDLSPGMPAWPFRRDADGQIDLKQRVESYELQLIHAALRACQGNQTQAADLLRIPRRTLVYKLRALREALPDVEPNLSFAETLDSELDFKERVQRFETKLIEDALAHCGGDRVAAARLLGVQKRTLDQKLDR